MRCPGFAFAHLFAILALATVSAPLQADVVDDLLAGKPVEVTDSESSGSELSTAGPSAPAAQAAESDRVVLSEEARAVADHAEALTVRLPAARIAEEAPRDQFLAGPPAPISLVPEPSAVGLASLALAYFFIFFRRRWA